MATTEIGYVTKCSEWGPRDPSYTLKKLHEALNDYDACIGVTADRLYEIFLSIHLLTKDDFPESLQSRFSELIQAMTSRHDTTPIGQQGRIGDARNTLRGMDPVGAQMILHMLKDLTEEVERSMRRQTERASNPSQLQLSAR